MFQTIFACSILFLLLMLTLPIPKARQWGLDLVHRVLQLMLLAVVLGAGAFVLKPEWVPGLWSETLQPVTTQVGAFVPPEWHRYLWVAFALAVVIVTLPWLTHLDYARRVAAHTATVNRVAFELRALRKLLRNQQAQPTQAAPAEPQPVHGSEVARAIDALQWLASGPEVPARRPRRVKDVLND